MRRAALAAVAFVVCLAADALVSGGAAHGATPLPGSYPVTSTPIALTQPTDPQRGLTPTADAARRGMFAPQVAWPIIPIHAALATNGHLITFGTPVGEASQEGMTYDDWNPQRAGGPHTDVVSMDTYNAFCNSLTRLADGTLLMVGGNSTMSSMLYNPLTSTESDGPSLHFPRWYNTTIRLPDNRIVVVGGASAYDIGAYRTPNDNSQIGITPEIYTPGGSSWTQLTGATSTTAYGAASNHWWYPRAFNAPDGTVFGVSGDQMWKLDPTGTGRITVLGKLPTSIGVSGSQVMYAPGKILFAGGGQLEDGDSITATNATTVVDINHAVPQVRVLRPMAAKRNWLNLTVLPTGEVLANGGTIVGRQGGSANSDYTNEIWDPARKAWHTGATAQRIRTYHSNALLLPDGAVFTGGGGAPGPEDNFNAEIYYPPYLFSKTKGQAPVWADRPEITTIAGSLGYGGAVTLRMSDGRTISSVSLITLGSTTHSENTDQRRIPVTYSQRGKFLHLRFGRSLSVMPPGSYLLQAVDANGVPSPSQLVTIEPNQPGQVTVYESSS